MKRLFYFIGIGFLLAIFSCAQHDPNKPDTSGSVPYDKPGVGIDTSNVQSGTQNTGTTNNNNDNSNNNQQVNTADSSQKKQ